MANNIKAYLRGNDLPNDFVRQSDLTSIKQHIISSPSKEDLDNVKDGLATKIEVAELKTKLKDEYYTKDQVDNIIKEALAKIDVSALTNVNFNLEKYVKQTDIIPIIKKIGFVDKVLANTEYLSKEEFKDILASLTNKDAFRGLTDFDTSTVTRWILDNNNRILEMQKTIDSFITKMKFLTRSDSVIKLLNPFKSSLEVTLPYRATSSYYSGNKLTLFDMDGNKLNLKYYSSKSLTFNGRNTDKNTDIPLVKANKVIAKANLDELINGGKGDTRWCNCEMYLIFTTEPVDTVKDLPDDFDITKMIDNNEYLAEFKFAGTETMYYYKEWPYNPNNSYGLDQQPHVLFLPTTGKFRYTGTKTSTREIYSRITLYNTGLSKIQFMPEFNYANDTEIYTYSENGVVVNERSGQPVPHSNTQVAEWKIR